MKKDEPTTSSDYFASTKKRGRPAKAPEPAKSNETKEETPSEKPKKTAVEPAKSQNTSRASTKKANKVVEDENLGDDDIFASEYGKAGKGDDEYVAGGDSEGDSDFEVLEVKPAAAKPKRGPAKKAPRSDEDEDVVMEDLPKIPAPRALPGRKRKSEALIDEDEDEDFEEPKKPAKKAAPKAKATASPAVKRAKASPKKAKKEDKVESKEIQDIFDSIPTIDAPEPPSGETKKWKFGQQQSREPEMAGTKELPTGEENCLAGLSFVFTGVLESLGRDEGSKLVKKYGGKVVGAPSSKTSYVVLGGDAGPKKLETIAKHNLKTINEDGLFELIKRLPANGGDGKAAEKYAEKQKADEEKVRAMAAEIDAEEKRKAASAKPVKTSQGPKSATSQQTPSSSQPASSSDLWTTKYAPSSTSMICGNKAPVEKLQNWLRNWHRNAKHDFKKGGADGSGIYRAVIIHGGPGIGKTTAAHLVAKLEGFDIVETNASDTRSKKLVESSTLGVLDTTSLQGYFAAEGKQIEGEKKNLVLIMDEVDGMSAGDRGGVGAVAAIVKKSKIPIILICNERRLPKMKPFDHITFEIPFRRPTADQIRARLSTICFREGLKIPPPVLDGLIEGTNADIRQVINMLSTARLDQQGLNYDQGKDMSKAWEKHIILKPWDIVSKILSAQMFAPSSTSTLNDKIALYFNDHEFSYLMLQENYLKTKPTLAGRYQGKEQKLKALELMDNAASGISDGDLVDRMIHGTQQQWSLMPVHAVFSFVRPASFQYGNFSERAGFTSWLGNNSKQGMIMTDRILLFWDHLLTVF